MVNKAVSCLAKFVNYTLNQIRMGLLLHCLGFAGSTLVHTPIINGHLLEMYRLVDILNRIVKNNRLTPQGLKYIIKLKADHYG